MKYSQSWTNNVTHARALSLCVSKNCWLLLTHDAWQPSLVEEEEKEEKQATGTTSRIWLYPVKTHFFWCHIRCKGACTCGYT